MPKGKYKRKKGNVYLKKHFNKRYRDFLYNGEDKKIKINRDQLNILLKSEYNRGIEETMKTIDILTKDKHVGKIFSRLLKK